MTSPNGSDKSSVRKNISAEVIIPEPSSISMVEIFIIVLQFFQAPSGYPLRITVSKIKTTLPRVNPPGRALFHILLSKNECVLLTPLLSNLKKCSVSSHLVKSTLNLVTKLCVSKLEANTVKL